jgi:hypothetical protein
MAAFQQNGSYRPGKAALAQTLVQQRVAEVSGVTTGCNRRLIEEDTQQMEFQVYCAPLRMPQV